MIRVHLELILTLSFLGQYFAMPNQREQYGRISHKRVLVPSMDVIPETATYVLEDPRDPVSEVLTCTTESFSTFIHLKNRFYFQSTILGRPADNAKSSYDCMNSDEADDIDMI